MIRRETVRRICHDAGVKAFSNGANQTRAPILHYSELNEDSPYYWEGMNGERIFMWYSRSYVQLKRLTGPGWGGNISSLEYLKRSVPQFLVRYVRDSYLPDAVMIYGAYVDNAAIPPHGEAPAIEAWNREFEFPKLVVATDADYFNYVEKHFAGRLPVYRGDCGAYWEDGVGSTMHATILNRRTQQVLPAAETAAALATIFEPRNRYPGNEFHRAWNNVMFYNEHTWGAHNSISQPGRQFVERQWEIKESYATRGNLDARNLLARGCNRLAQQIAVDGSSILAFNWQNRPRTAPLEVEIGTQDQLVDLADNKPVPMDIYFEQDGWRKVRFMARDVPPMGYKAYAIRGLDPAAHKGNEKLGGDTIENQFYRLAVGAQTGGLKSLFDKTANRELLDTQAPYKLNEYLYVAGGEGSLILNFTFGTPPANLTIHRPEQATITKVRKTPLGQRLIVERLDRSGMGGRAFEPVSTAFRAWFNPNLDSRSYFVPGVIALLLMVISIILSSMAIVREREQGTIEQLLRYDTQRLGPVQPCPQCGRDCPVRTEPRDLVVRGATVHSDEPVCHCPACRRDFFQ